MLLRETSWTWSYQSSTLRQHMSTEKLSKNDDLHEDYIFFWKLVDGVALPRFNSPTILDVSRPGPGSIGSGFDQSSCNNLLRYCRRAPSAEKLFCKFINFVTMSLRNLLQAQVALHVDSYEAETCIDLEGLFADIDATSKSSGPSTS